jgi:hypothetical protein
MREPIAVPKTMKYSEVVKTGLTMLCTEEREKRAISDL